MESQQRFYLLNPRLKQIARGNFYYAGLYLGKVKNGIFFPSFNLLNMLADVAQNRVVADRKAAWLFICGRDLFQKGIVRTQGSQRKGDFTLVMNEFGEGLGFGKITQNLGEDKENQAAVRNLLDVGDFLRRER